METRILPGGGSAIQPASVTPIALLGLAALPATDLLPTGFPPFAAALGGLALRRVHFLAGTRGSGATTPTASVLLLDGCSLPPPIYWAGAYGRFGFLSQHQCIPSFVVSATPYEQAAANEKQQ